MQSFISKNILTFINDNISLGQILAVILFFECYSIHFTGISIFDLKFDLSSIKLKPFFALIYFILISKIIWSLLTLLKYLIPAFYKQETEPLNESVSFTAFLLFLVCGYYSFLTNSDNSLFLFYTEDNEIFNKLMLSPFLLITVISFIIVFFFNSRFSNINKEGGTKN